MTEAAFQLVRAAGFVAALGLAAALQHSSPHAAVAASRRTNVALWSMNVVLLAVVCGACTCTVARWAEAAGLGLLNWAGAPVWTAIPATVLALDLLSYGWHRANHRVALLWRFHQVHHSDPGFTASTALRFHPCELLLSLPLRLAVVAAVGAPVAGIIVFEVAFTFSNLIEHGNIDLPAALERRLAHILVTPALHRRHHSVRRHELDSNFGTIFTCWDRLLDTYLASFSTKAVRTGLAGMREPVTFWTALVLPLRAGPRR